MMRRVLMGLIVMLCVACLQGGLTGSSTVTGAYTLRTINGSALPYTIASSGTSKTEIVDDVITLFQGGTYAESGHSRTTLAGQVSNESNSETGSYGLVGTSVTFQSSDRTRSRLMTITANTMTFVEPGMTSVFSK
jgi:hypothetical protein